MSSIDGIGPRPDVPEGIETPATAEVAPEGQEIGDATATPEPAPPKEPAGPRTRSDAGMFDALRVADALGQDLGPGGLGPAPAGATAAPAAPPSAAAPSPPTPAPAAAGAPAFEVWAGEVGAMLGDLVAHQMNEPAQLLAEAPVPANDLAAGLADMDAQALAKASADLAALEAQVAALAAKMGENAVAQTVAPAPPVPERPAAQAAAPARETRGSDATQASSSAAGAAGGAASAAGGAGGAGAAGGARGASAEKPIQAQDEQGGASLAYTANIAETAPAGEAAAAQPVEVSSVSAEARVSDVAAAESLARAAADPTRPFAERLGAAIDLAERAIAELEAEAAAAAES